MPSSFRCAFIPRIARWVAVAALLVAPVGVAAQQETATDRPSAIEGIVVEADTRAPLAGVRVQATPDGPSATTNARGQFRLPDLEPELMGDEESVEVRFERLGFAPLTESMRPGADSLEIPLERAALRLDPVSVLSERTRMIGDPTGARSFPGSAFHLDRQDLNRQALPVDNVHEVLRQVPGVQVTDEEGYGLRPNIGLRGTGTERSSNVTLMEDGVLIAPAPYSAPAAYYFPSVGRMDGVEVRTGASQIRYGPRTLGGAINLLTAPIPDERELRAEVAGGGDDLVRGHLRAGDASTHVGWMVEGYGARTDGFKELPDGGGTGFDDRDVLGKLRFNTDREAGRYQELELKLGLSEHQSDETYLGLTEEDFRSRSLFRYPSSAEDVMDAEHRQMQLRYFLQPGERTDLVVTGYRNEFARNWYKLQSVQGASIGDVLGAPESHASRLAVLKGEDSADDALTLRANNREYVSQGIQTTFGFRAGADRAVQHDLEVGLRVHRDHEDRLQWEDGYRMENGGLVVTSEGAPGSQANRLSEASAVAIHVQNEATWGPWTAVPGVRFESIDFVRSDWAGDDPGRTQGADEQGHSVSAVVPGLGVSYEWSPRLHLFSGVHRGFAPPGPGAAEETRAESATSYETGLRLRRSTLGLNVTGFFSDYSNILGESTLATGGTGVGDLHNGGAVHVFGLEAAVDADLGRALELPVALPVRAAYTFHRGSFRTEFESDYGAWGTVERGDRLPYMPTHALSGSVGVEDTGWGVSLGWHTTSTMRTEAGQGPVADGSKVPSHLTFDLSGEVDLGRGASAFATLQNVTDERYVVSRRPAGVRPGMPRTFVAGMRFAP